MSVYEQANKSFTEVILPFRVAFRRYWRISWAPAVTILALVTVVALRLPSYYMADSLIFIQPQRISSKIVEGPSRVDQSDRLDAMKAEILTRGRLRTIIEQFGLYPDLQGVVGKERALERFRGSFKAEPIISKTNPESLIQTFRLSFIHANPKIAYEVTKALSNLFIEESILTTKTETQGTEEFLDAQLGAARKKLEATEGQVQKFVQENFGKLPEHLTSSVARLEQAQAQLSTNTQLITANVTRISSLEQQAKLAEKDAPSPSVSGFSAGTSGDPEENVAQLESALAVLRTKYSDQHPDVVAVRKQIDVLKQRVVPGKSRSRGPDVRMGTTAESRGIRREIAETEAQLASLKAENADLKKSIAELESDIRQMPLKEQELIRIKRDYANVKQNYESLSAAREQAAMQTNLVSSQKGTQFRIIEPPALPVIPAGPPRSLIVAAGAAAAMLCFAAVPLLLFALSGAYKFRDEIEDELGVHVIGVIPPLATTRALGSMRRALAFSVLTSVALFVFGSIGVFLTL